jgi:transaldolase
VLYMGALAAPNTANTVPEETLLAFANHGQIGKAMPRDGGDSEQVLVSVARAGIDVAALAKELQDQGAKGFVDSWKDERKRALGG